MGRAVSATAEHITVCSHVVVPHEQLASEGFEIEVISEIAHRPFKVVALVDDVTGDREAASTNREKTLLRYPIHRSMFFASKALRDDFEIVERVVEIHIIIDCFGIVLFAHLVVFENFRLSRNLVEIEFLNNKEMPKA